MIMADKIIDLRKKNGWSQEELAEQLGVSRQSVSKWEGAQSVPDMNKIIAMARLFNVSTDYLLKDEIEMVQAPEDTKSTAMDNDPPARRVSMEEANEYLVKAESSARQISFGVMLCILSPIVLILLSVAGIVRVLVIFEPMQTVSLLILLFWIIRNLYFLIMALFLVDGRDSDGETVKVRDAEPVVVKAQGTVYEGITTLMTEHNMSLFLDDSEGLTLGTSVEISLQSGDQPVSLQGIVTGIQESRHGRTRTHTVEILDFHGDETEYWQILYDRIPTLPQSLRRDFGVLTHLWQNIAYRVARTRK